jgi:hypothetical protein
LKRGCIAGHRAMVSRARAGGPPPGLP